LSLKRHTTSLAVAANCCVFIYCSCKETVMALKRLIDDNYDLLHRSFNPSSKLFVKLRSVAAIAHHLPSIKQQPTVNEKNAALFDALLDVPDDLQEQVMNEFTAALRLTGQDHVANIFRPESNDVPMSDEHYNLLTSKRISICQFIKPNDGLADHLVASGALSDADRTTVLSKPQIDDRAEELVNILLRKSDSAFGKFVNALNETGQSHAAYLLTGVGPPPMSDQHRETLRTKMDELCKFVDVENGLLDQLVSKNAVSVVEADRVRSVSDDNVMARNLVRTLLRKHDGAFDDFIEALNYTRQGHVTYILTGEGESRPLKDEVRNTLLSKHRDNVINMIDSKDSSFITALMSKGVFSSYDEQRVVSVRPDTTYNRNELILNLVARKSQSAFSNFISALNDTDQTHVVVALIGRDVFVKIKPYYENGGAIGDDVPPNVNAELLQYVRETFESNGKVVQRLREILSENGVAVTDVREGCIQVTFTCKTLKSLQYFQQLCKSGELATLLNEAFCPKFADKGLQSLAIEISEEQFDNCEKTFLHLAPMTTQHRKALESSEESLAKKVTVNDVLLEKLKLRGRRRQAIESATTREQQVKTLLDIVSRRPDSAYTELLYALRSTQEPQTVDILLAQTESCAEKAPAEGEFHSSVGLQALKRTIDVSEMEIEEKKRQKMDLVFKDMVTDNFKLLLRCMDPSNELLGELLSVKFVNDRLSTISRHVTIDGKTNALLTALLQIPDKLQEQIMDRFVAALRNSGQDHVANIFRRESDTIPMTDEHNDTLVKQRHQLCQFLDPENGLLDKLVSNGVISCVDNRRIRSKIRIDIMAGELLDTILKKSDDAFEALIQALNETGQSHVSSFLTEKSNMFPLSQALMYRLVSHRYYMVNTMEAKNSGLVSALITKGVFSQYDALRVTNKYHEVGIIINETILDLLMRKAESSFDLFIEALNDTGQEHIAATLQTDVKPSTSAYKLTAKPNKGLVSLDNYHKHMLTKLSDRMFNSKHSW